MTAELAATCAEIRSMGYAYPRERVDNDGFYARLRFEPRWDRATIERETRMRLRWWCAEDENTWTLARRAVERVLDAAPAHASEIDLVVVASGTTWPVLLPSDPALPGMGDLAPRVVELLGRSDVLGIDVKACYCTGFLRGLQIADALLAANDYRAALVVAAEQGSRLALGPENRSAFTFLMADAAGAALLCKRPAAPGVGLVDHVGWTEGDKLDWVAVGADGASMVVRGKEAGEATRTGLVRAAKTLLARNHLSPDDVDWLLPIQTHAGVVDSVLHDLGWPADKTLWRGDVTGFSGSASIPACLAEQIEKGIVHKGQLVLSIAVGAGMSFAGSLFHY